MGWFGFTRETRQYFRVLTKGVSRDLVSRKDFLLSVAVTRLAFVISFLITGEIDVTALVTFAVLFARFSSSLLFAAS